MTSAVIDCHHCQGCDHTHDLGLSIATSHKRRRRPSTTRTYVQHPSQDPIPHDRESRNPLDSGLNNIVNFLQVFPSSYDIISSFTTNTETFGPSVNRFQNLRDNTRTACDIFDFTRSIGQLHKIEFSLDTSNLVQTANIVSSIFVAISKQGIFIFNASYMKVTKYASTAILQIRAFVEINDKKDHGKWECVHRVGVIAIQLIHINKIILGVIVPANVVASLTLISFTAERFSANKHQSHFFDGSYSTCPCC